MIAAGPAIVWLFLQQSFDLFRTEDDIELLTPLAQYMVKGRQYLSVVATVLACTAGIWLFALGIKWLKAGEEAWKSIQTIHDEILELERDSKRAGLRPQTSSEIVDVNSIEVESGQGLI